MQRTNSRPPQGVGLILSQTLHGETPNLPAGHDERGLTGETQTSALQACDGSREDQDVSRHGLRGLAGNENKDRLNLPCRRVPHLGMSPKMKNPRAASRSQLFAGPRRLTRIPILVSWP